LLIAGVLYALALPGVGFLVLSSKNFFPAGLVPLGVVAASIPAGLALAPRVGFRSIILDRLSGRPAPGLASGMAYAALLAVLLGVLWAVPARMLSFYPSSVPIARWLCQGAVLEELMFRWCGMSLGVFILWKWLGRDPDQPEAPSIGRSCFSQRFCLRWRIWALSGRTDILQPTHLVFSCFRITSSPGSFSVGFSGKKAWSSPSPRTASDMLSFG
jgi:hypothetical protein